MNRAAPKHEKHAPASTSAAQQNTHALRHWLSTSVLENIAGLSAERVLRGEPLPNRPTPKRRFPWIDFYGDERMVGGLPGHRHEQPELATVLEGELHIGIGQQIYKAGPGDWLVFAPHVLHGECALPSRRRYVLVWFALFKGALSCHATRYTRSAGYEPVSARVRQPASPELRATMRRLIEQPWAPIAAARCDLVQLVHRCLQQLSQPSDHSDNVAAHPLVTEVAQLIRRRLDRPPTVVELANHVGLSPNYLSSLFHQQTGQTLRDFMNAARVEQARDLLARPEANVKTVAYQLGFADPHHFSRVFSRVTGQSPSAYRRRTLEAADT